MTGCLFRLILDVTFTSGSWVRVLILFALREIQNLFAVSLVFVGKR